MNEDPRSDERELEKAETFEVESEAEQEVEMEMRQNETEINVIDKTEGTDEGNEEEVLGVEEIVLETNIPVKVNRGDDSFWGLFKAQIRNDFAPLFIIADKLGISKHLKELSIATKNIVLGAAGPMLLIAIKTIKYIGDSLVSFANEATRSLYALQARGVDGLNAGRE